MRIWILFVLVCSFFMSGCQLIYIGRLFDSNKGKDDQELAYSDDEQPEVEDIEVISTEDNLKEDPEVLEFYQVEQKAEFKYGLDSMYRFINRKIIVPDSALSHGLTGMVLVSFIVEKNGRISNVKIDPRSKRVGYGCEQASIDVVRKMSGMWTPAIQNGKPVRMRFSLPIKFILN